MLIAILGFILVCVGIACVLKYWHLLIGLALGLLGPVLALIGLVLMFYASLRR